jgi:magnesium chelatase accessory protein
MEWRTHAATWPHGEHSRFILCKPHKWHVQEAGKGPLLLLIHGAGGGTQSWRHLWPLLTPHYRVIAIDLPGQGFTKAGSQQRFGLSPMAEDIAALCRAEAWTPAAIIGHSAGAAIALEMARHMDTPPPVIGINAALGNFKGLAGVLFPLMAKALAMTPFVARMFTASAARPGSVTRLVEGTGSKLSQEDLAPYRALVSDPTHVDATLNMMAQWDLNPLLAALPEYKGPVHLIATEGDKAVPAGTSRDMAAKIAGTSVTILPDLGHLAHEEAPEVIFEEIQYTLNGYLPQTLDNKQ